MTLQRKPSHVPPMFRFTIRDVLWLTVVVALAVGWCIERQRLATSLGQKNHEAEAATLRAKIAELRFELSLDRPYPVDDGAAVKFYER